MARRVWVIAASALAMAAIVAAPAMAAATKLWLVPSQTVGYYLQDCSLTPSVNTTALPGDKIELQILNGTEWEKFEDQLVEETETIDPIYIQFDDSFTYPVKMRAVWRSKASKFETGPISPTVTLKRLKYHTTETRVVGVPRNTKVDRSFMVDVMVKRNPGIGNVRVEIQRRVPGTWTFKNVAVKRVQTDEIGMVTLKLKPRDKGTYRIRASFAGNAWGPASTSTWKYYTAR